MPLSKYNKFFGGNAAKAKRAMTSQYGSQRGEEVFYASINKKKKNKSLKQAIKRRVSNG